MTRGVAPGSGAEPEGNPRAFLRVRPGRAWNSVRPTMAGVWFVLVLIGLLVGAVNTGNNLVYIVLATLLAVLIVNNLLAEWNLRGLAVRRVIPAEVYAGEAGDGSFILVNPKRFGAAWQVRVDEVGAAGATARFASVPAGEEREEGARWTFPRRGVEPLRQVRITSEFPFGLVRRWRELEIPAEVLVYPTPERGVVESGGVGLGEATSARATREGVAELAGMRPYEAGDPVKRIHWPTSARIGQPVVALRSTDASGEVVIHLEDGGEASIRRACGAVLLHTRRGDAVGLRVGEEVVTPRAGASHRRRLLTTLALLPERG